MLKINLVAKGSFREQLNATLLNNPDATSLDFTNIQLGVIKQEELCAMFAVLRNSNINHLILSAVGFQYKSGTELKDLMDCFHGSKLTSIILTNNFFATQGKAELIEFLSGFERTKIHSIDLRYNDFESLTSNERSNIFAILNKLSIHYILDIPEKTAVFFKQDPLLVNDNQLKNGFTI